MWYKSGGKGVATGELAWVYCNLLAILFTEIDEYEEYLEFHPKKREGIILHEPNYSKTGELVHWNSLTFQQQKATLPYVALAMLDPNVPCPHLTAISEAVAAAPFYQLYMKIREEIDVQEDMRGQVDECHFGYRACAIAYLYAVFSEDPYTGEEYEKEPLDLEDDEDAEYEEDEPAQMTPLSPYPENVWDTDIEKWTTLIDLLIEPYFADRDWTLGEPKASPDIPAGIVHQTRQALYALHNIEPDYYSTDLHKIGITGDGKELRDDLYNRFIKPLSRKPPETIVRKLKSAQKEYLLNYKEIKKVVSAAATAIDEDPNFLVLPGYSVLLDTELWEQ